MNLTEDYRISQDLDDQYPRTRLEGGEVLLNLVGASIGRSAIAPSELRGANVTRAIAVIPVVDDYAEWVQLALQSPVGRALMRDATGGSAQPVLNLEEVRSLNIPVPPPTVAKKLSKLGRREIDRIKTLSLQIKALEVELNQLDESLLATAFRGELVPQDPADEPASILLDRIRAASAETAATPRTRRPRVTAAVDAPAPVAAHSPVTESTSANPTGWAYAVLRTALRQRGSLSSGDAQTVTNLDATAVRPLLQRLVTDGHARIEGQKRGTRYVAQ